MTDQRKRKQREDWTNTGPSESAQFVGAGGRGLVWAEGDSRLDMMNMGIG
jgi:hypothetical protein